MIHKLLSHVIHDSSEPHTRTRDTDRRGENVDSLPMKRQTQYMCIYIYIYEYVYLYI